MKILTNLLLFFLTVSLFAQKNDKIEFSKSNQTFNPSKTFQVELADLDADGDLDAVTANMHKNHGQILLNDGKGNFTDSGQKLTTHGHGVGIGDIDNDGDLDIVMTCANTGYKTSIYFNDGKANFSKSEQLINDTEFSGNCIDLVDIDCDGDLDFTIDYYNKPYGIYLNDGKGNFSKSDKTFGVGKVVVFENLNKDNYIDVFIKTPNEGYQVLLNDGKGNFKEKWSLIDTSTTHGYYSVALEDFDKDGDKDAFICNGDHNRSSESFFLLNNGKGKFKNTKQNYEKTKWAWCETADLNNDGYLDIFISNFLIPNEIWINDSKGSFYKAEVDLTGEKTTRGFSIGDIDNDGDQDVFLGSFVKGSNEIWLNGLK